MSTLVLRGLGDTGNTSASYSVFVDTNIIPVMTSATAPSGVASASGNYSGYDPWKAFDHTGVGYESGGYTWLVSGTTGLLQYQFPTAHVVTRYAISTRNIFDWPASPKAWNFEGSNDGAAWTTLDTQTNITDWATPPNNRRVFDIVNTTAYAYYRLDITESTGPFTGVTELEMMETVYLGAGSLLALGGMGDGEEAPVVAAAELDVHVTVNVADPYPLPRLSYVVPAATLEVHVTVRVAA